MTMRRISLLPILLATLTALCVQAQSPKPQIYRWKDSKGKLYITTTPPPPGSTVLGIPSEQNVKEPDAPKAPPLKPGPVKLAAPANQELTESQRGFWQILAQTLGDARAKGDRVALETASDSLVKDSFWGNGLWVLPILPLASFFFLLLVGWLIASSFKGVTKIGVMALFVLLGLGSAQFTLARFVFKAQVQRLTGNLMLLELNLGGEKSLSPAHKEELDERLRALENGTHATSAPWRFVREAKSLKETLRQVVVDP